MSVHAVMMTSYLRDILHPGVNSIWSLVSTVVLTP